MWAVLDYTETRTISRELLLVKVSILGPEYLDAQLTGGPHHDPRAGGELAGEAKFERETTLAHTFELAGRGAPDASSPPAPAHPASAPGPTPLTPSEALRIKHQHLQSIATLADQFGAKIVDVSENSVIVEMTGKTTRVEAFLALLSPFGVLESARSGPCSHSCITCGAADGPVSRTHGASPHTASCVTRR